MPGKRPARHQKVARAINLWSYYRTPNPPLPPSIPRPPAACLCLDLLDDLLVVLLGEALVAQVLGVHLCKGGGRGVREGGMDEPLDVIRTQRHQNF